MRLFKSKNMSLLFSITVAFGIAIQRESRATVEIEYTIPKDIIPIRKVENKISNYYLLIQGLFLNSCFLTDKVEYSIDHLNRIFIKNGIKYEFDNFCLMVLTPYEHLVKLGKLRSGDYLVYALSPDHNWVLVSTFKVN